MLKLVCCFLSLLSILVGSSFSQAETPTRLAAKIEAVIDGPDYKESRWGILVVDSQTGETLYARDADRLYSPASTTKLYSGSTALAALGPDYRFETPVYRRGEVTNGKLEGDLIFVAQGDLTLGGRTDVHGRMTYRNYDHIYVGLFPKVELTDTDPLAGLKDLAHQVAATGIRQVEGDVLIDDRLFDKAEGSGSGPRLVTPIVVNDNVLDFVTIPGKKPGDLAQVTVRPDVSFLHIDSHVETVADNEKPLIQINRTAPNQFVADGRIPVKARSSVLILPVEDPTAFARALFIEMLKREGVSVKTGANDLPSGWTARLPDWKSYGQLPQVARFSSPPFSELLKVTLKVSHNLYASTFPLLVAVKEGKRTLADGLLHQGRFLADLGLEVKSISFAGGAGGNAADAATPQATVQLLRALAKRPDFQTFKEALPILGVDGTLVESVPANSPIRGKVWAKTGTEIHRDFMNDRFLLRTKALAGYLTTAHGRELTLAMFVNNVPLPKNVTSSREGETMGKLCEIIYREVP
jgi:D-alanyl-D-alanine carboxypeptidase/D-alanyl-D-alanine-endopeptidase (penicillin-binding protein 4)